MSTALVDFTIQHMLATRASRLGDTPATKSHAEPVAVCDDEDFYFSQIDADARAFLNRPRQRPVRCVWCHLSDGRHTPFCAEMLDGWAMKMEWGKHKGSRVRDVPRDYLLWLWKKRETLTSELRAEVAQVLNVRDQVGDSFLN